jgi:hypothetical protein
MLVNFVFELKHLNGNIIKEGEGEKQRPIDSSVLIGNILINPSFKGGDDVKKYLLAQRIVQEKEFNVDKADFELIKNAVECKELSVPTIYKAQIILKLREAEAASNMPKK